MHPPALSFQLLLLSRMSASYRDAVLGDIGMSETEAARIHRTCSLRLPQQLDSDLATYTALLGQPVKSEKLANVPAVFSGSTAHHFVMPLWPHLYWTVNSRPDGASWGVGFRNQVEPGSVSCDPSIVRRGVWTRSALESIAARADVHDGWDEEVVLRLELAGGVYEASFIFGLLQDWRPVQPTAKQGAAG